MSEIWHDNLLKSIKKSSKDYYDTDPYEPKQQDHNDNLSAQTVSKQQDQNANNKKYILISKRMKIIIGSI